MRNGIKTHVIYEWYVGRVHLYGNRYWYEANSVLVGLVILHRDLGSLYCTFPLVALKKKGITKVPSKLKWFMYINLLLVQDYICWLEYSRSVLQGNLSTIHEGFHYVYKNVLCTHFRVYKHIYRTLTEKRSLPRRYSMKFNETHALLFSSCLRTKIYMNIYIYFK